MHAMIDDLVVLLLPSGLGQGRTGVQQQSSPRHSQGFQVVAALLARSAGRCGLESVSDLRIDVTHWA